MIRYATAITLLGAFALSIPGGAFADGAQTIELKIAMLAPRGSTVVREFQKFDQDLRAQTNNAVGLKIYPSGIAGDEFDVIRKMKVGQMDAAILTDTGLGNVVRAVNVLNAPGVVPNYQALEAVQREMNAEWGQEFLDNGFKLLQWGELGQYRYFSTEAIVRPGDLRQMRPWLWPQSHTMKELWSAIGTNGVPLGVPEVYGALQTKMVDSVICTCIALTVLQWHTKLRHMTKNPRGVLTAALVLNKSKWDSLPQNARDRLEELAARGVDNQRREARATDKRAHDKLIQVGFVEDVETPQASQEWEQVFATVRQRLTGRIFSAELLQRVQAIARRAGG
jgi:TRAP-type C4-dicarboxylate transport system substrate-binding protein